MADQLLDRYLAPAARNQGDPLDGALEDENRKRASAAFLTTNTSPDAAARANVLARQAGVPAETVERNLPLYERDAQVGRARMAMDQHPGIAAWAADPRNAAIGRDDTDALSKVAETARRYPTISTWNQSMDEMRQRQQYWRGATGGATISSTPAPAPSIMNVIQGVGANLNAARQGIVQMGSDFLSWAGVGAPASAPGVPRLADGRASTLIDTQRAQLRADAAAPAFKSRVASGLYGGVSSLVQQSPGLVASVLTGNPLPALAYAGVTTGSQSYGKYRARGGTPGEAALGGAGEGAVEVATELIPMGHLISAFGKNGAKGFLGEVAKSIISDVPGEQIATLAQDAIDTAIANPNKTWGEYMRERPGAAVETLVATLTQGALTAGGGLVAHRIGESQRIAQANADGQFLTDLASGAQESKVRQRDPSAFARFLEIQAEGKPVEKLYIPGEVVAQFYQSQGMDWHEPGGPFEFDDTVPGQIDQALATGGDVVVNTAGYVAHLAGSPAWEAMADHVRARPDGLSLSEARSYEDDYADEMTRRGEDAASQAKAEAAQRSPTTQVYQEVFDQARQAGFNVRAARAYAETWSARYEARAARSPELGDALGAFRESNVRIEQETPPSVAPYRRADQMDVLINAMQRDRGAPRQAGPSLLEWIAKSGGVEDPGGDIASMGGDRWHKDKKFRKRLIKDAADARQGAMSVGEASASNNALDVMFRNAVDAGYFPEHVGRDESTYGDALDERAEMLAAIEGELRGSPRYAETRTDAARETEVSVQQAAEDLRAMLESRGVDPDTATRADIDAAVKSYGLGEDVEADDARGLSQFAGLRALDAPIQDLNRALAMDREGKGKVIIEDETGWRKGPDGEWRWEIDDSRAKFKKGADRKVGHVTILGDLIDHPDLFESYPSLADVPVKITEGAGGSWSGQAMSLGVKNLSRGEAREGMGVLLHEIQHAIQTLENFARGASPKPEALRSQGYGDALDAEMERLRASNNQDDAGGWGSAGGIEEADIEGQAARNVYERSAGEIEARNTQARRNMTLAERREDSALWTQDRMDSTAIVRLLPGDVERRLRQGERGRIDIYNDGRNVIRLFEDRDLSTLLHESGHLWLEELRRDAEREGSSDQVKADWQAARDWFEKAGHPVENGGEIPTDAHEMWARGMERYFMEGKSPSASLRAAFDTFKGWLLRIYQMAANLRTPLTPEVRDVMGRLLATDDAISDAQDASDARALFTSADQAGMTDAEFADYQSTVGATRSAAFDALLYRTMETVRRQRTAEWKTERRGVRDTVATSIGNRPEFRALSMLRGKGAERVALNREALVAMNGVDALRMIPKGVPPTVVDNGGVHPDILAELVGLTSGADLMERLMGIQQRENQLREIGDKRTALNEAVDIETDEIMRQRHGDALTDGSIEEEALAAIHNDERSTILASEVRQLARRAGEVPTPWRLAREWAERTVRDGRIADQSSAAALAQHRRNEQKAGRAAERAMLAGDIDEAFNQKQAQMLNHAMWRAAKDAKDEVDSMVRRLGKLAKAKTLPSMDQDYLDRIHDLLEDYDFRPRSRRENAERGSFAAWVAAREAEGEEVYIPPRLSNAEAVNWSQMTYGDLTALDDTVASIAHLGRRKRKLLIAQEERDHDELVGEAIQGAAAVPDLPTSNARNPKRYNINRIHAELVKVESIADDMDDGNPNGVFNKVLIRGATEAANKKSELTESVLKPLGRLYLDMDKAQRKRLLEKIDIPEFVDMNTGGPTNFSRMELLAVALNTGNESNLDKMLRGEGWSQAALDSVLSRELNQQDWQFVQGVWDQIDTLWPEIARVERELTGVVPERVEPRTVSTKFGPLRGGYYPLVYDPNHPRASERTRENASKDAEQFFGQHGRNVGTPKGHTIERTEFAGPLLYSVEAVLFNHVNRVTTRIAYGRYIRDSLKFTRDGRIRSLVRKKLGQDLLDQIEPWLRRQVNEAALNTRDIRGFEKALRGFRINATMVGLGFRFTTMAAQAAGLNNSAAMIGPKWVATGMAEWMSKRGEAKAAVFAASPEMARRAEEFDRDVSTAFRQMSGKASRMDGIRAMAFWGIGQIDVHVVAIPTWLGAYRKGLSEGMSETDAAAYGDKVVRQSQAAGRAKDLASLQDSSEFARVATMFYSYFNALYQQQRMAVRAGMRGDYRKASQITFFTMIAGPLMSSLLIGDTPGKDEDWLEWAATRVFFGLWASVPYVRDIASAGQSVVTGKARGFKDALDKADQPVIRAFVSLGTLLDDFYKGAHDGEMPDKWVRHAIETPGYFVGLPTGQVGATADYGLALAQGDQHPDGPGQVAYGVMKGRQRDQE